jgi:ribonucleoside-diphosphate reductase alpha chain
MSVATQEFINHVQTRKRDGRIVDFDANRIELAIEKAFRADRGIPHNEPLDRFSAHEVREITADVVGRIHRELRTEISIEEIQDLVEILLMQCGHYSVVRRYIVYREERSKARKSRGLEESSIGEEAREKKFFDTHGTDVQRSPNFVR